jgi:YD repeat-containing protein
MGRTIEQRRHRLTSLYAVGRVLTTVAPGQRITTFGYDQADRIASGRSRTRKPRMTPSSTIPAVIGYG